MIATARSVLAACPIRTTAPPTSTSMLSLELGDEPPTTGTNMGSSRGGSLAASMAYRSSLRHVYSSAVLISRSRAKAAMLSLRSISETNASFCSSVQTRRRPGIPARTSIRRTGFRGTPMSVSNALVRRVSSIPALQPQTSGQARWSRNTAYVASFSLTLNGLRLVAEVTAADTVTCTLVNHTAAAIDLATGTIQSEKAALSRARHSANRLGRVQRSRKIRTCASTTLLHENSATILSRCAAACCARCSGSAAACSSTRSRSAASPFRK